MNKPASELIALADALDAWGSLVSSGYEVPGAGQVMTEAAHALRLAANQSGSERPGVDALRDEGEIPERETWWLIERRGPSYTKSPDSQPNWTCDPWRAHRFKTAREADNARLRLISHRDESRVVEHVFINKMPTALHSPKIAAADDDTETCIACNIAFVEGDLIYPDQSGGCIHVSCCGPEMESYVNADGEPLKDGDPLPTPQRWTSAAAETSPGDVLAMKEACIRICLEEAAEWDSDNVQTLKNYAGQCANRIDRLDVKAEAKSQEPDAVAWRVRSYLDQYEITSRAEIATDWRTSGLNVEPLYTHPTTKPEAPAVGVDAIAGIIDPVAFDPISLSDNHPGWEHRRETARETATAIAAIIAGGR